MRKNPSLARIAGANSFHPHATLESRNRYASIFRLQSLHLECPGQTRVEWSRSPDAFAAPQATAAKRSPRRDFLRVVMKCLSTKVPDSVAGVSCIQRYHQNPMTRGRVSQHCGPDLAASRWWTMLDQNRTLAKPRSTLIPVQALPSALHFANR